MKSVCQVLHKDVCDSIFKIIFKNWKQANVPIASWYLVRLLPWWLRGLSVCLQCGRPGSIPEMGRSPGEGNGNPLQYSCLENLTDRGAWEAAVHGVTKSGTRLSDFTFTFHFHPQQCTGDPVAPHPCQHLLLFLKIIAILMSVKLTLDF